MNITYSNNQMHKHFKNPLIYDLVNCDLIGYETTIFYDSQLGAQYLTLDENQKIELYSISEKDKSGGNCYRFPCKLYKQSISESVLLDCLDMYKKINNVKTFPPPEYLGAFIENHYGCNLFIILNF